MNQAFINNCRRLLSAYQAGELWYMKMPEDANPWFSDTEKEMCLAYFTLPMALNYQRNSYSLRESVLKTYNDEEIRHVFNIKQVSNMKDDELRRCLIKHKVALQPNKHIQTWKKISDTIEKNRWSIENLFAFTDHDFLELKKTIQKDYKQWFPYLSGPKIFNYRSFIIQKYWGITLKNSEFIDIAPDTHITKCSVRLWVISDDEAIQLTKDQISDRWRQLLQWSGINPIDMHPPLRFRSRNNFLFKL